MASSHTPGPWTATYSDSVGEWTILGANGEHITSFSNWEEPATGDAHLIAASPDLLTALGLLAKFIQVAEIRFGSAEQQESCEHLLDCALAAIAQAKGGSR